MPVEKTIERARVELDSGNILRAKQILKSSLGNYGFSPRLFRAYADVLLALGEPAQAGRYLFFSIDTLAEEDRDPVDAFLSKHTDGGYKSIVRALPGRSISRLTELPAFSQRKMRDLGAPEDISKMYSDDDGGRWVLAGCLIAALIVMTLASIGLFTVFLWITK